MTIELFRADPYRVDLVAVVVAQHDDWAVLDRTIFWPCSDLLTIGDIGWLGEHQIIKVSRTHDGCTRHHFDPENLEPKLQVGTPTLSRIDWPHRYLQMRTHTAYHLVDLALRATNDVTGITPHSVADGYLTLSVTLARGQIDTVAVRQWIISIVREDLPMSISTDSTIFGSPMWHLDGLGHRRCNAPHVGSTGEVGAVNIDVVEGESAQFHVRVDLRSGAGGDGGSKPGVLDLGDRQGYGPAR